MSRFFLDLPDIDYGHGLHFPIVTNRLFYPPRFYRWGSVPDSPYHCFVDDWRLEAIWRHKYKAVDRVLMSGYAIAPDFTIETTTPDVYAFYQVWRSRVIAKYWHDHGIIVVPSLQWGNTHINPRLFAGLNDCEVVAVRSPTKGTEQQWRLCAEQFLTFHTPKLVLHFGTKSGLDVWPNAINLNLR